MLFQSFRRPGHLLIPVLLIGLLAMLSACSSSSSDPAPEPAGPRVVVVDPVDLDSNVNTSRHIQVNFDRALDAGQDLRQVISIQARVPGSDPVAVDITTVNRPSPESIDLEHTGYPQGAEITVTLTGLIRSSNGGTLGTPYDWTFWTQSSQPLFLRGIPTHESEGAATNTQIFLLFSEEMNLTVARDEIILHRTLPEPLPGQPLPELDFTVTRGEDAWLIIEPNLDLQAGSKTRVTIPSTLTTENGNRALGTTSFVSFTAADEPDTTPPTMIGMEPPTGATISAETQFIRFYFDEPIDPDSFQPKELGGQFYIVVENAPSEPQWSENFTVFTLPLPNPLPPGLPLRAVLDEFKDFAGNAHTDDLVYSVTVSGQANYYPFVDGLQFTFAAEGFHDEGSGQVGPMFWERFEGLRRQDADNWNRVDFERDFVQTDGWDILSRGSTAILLEGFVDEEDMTDVTTTLDPAVEWLRLPPSAQTWGGTSTASNPGGSITIEYTGELVVQEDIPLISPEANEPTKRAVWGNKKSEEPQIIWYDSWRMYLNYEMKQGETTVQSGADTLWYAPAVGLVWEYSGENDDQEGTWDRSRAWLTRFALPGWPEPEEEQ